MATQNQDRLRTHFASLPPSAHGSAWDTLWEAGTFIPWDRGYANPALIDLLSSPSSPPTSANANPTPGAAQPDATPSVQLPPPVRSDGKRARVLVPGCGKGYDVALFASYGYDAVGLEISEHAAAAAKKYLQEAGEGALEGEYKLKDKGLGLGRMECVVGNYFEDAWLGHGGGERGFDVIYDNTFLCALPYDLRPQWAARTSSLLAPSGILICLEFPTHKPVTSGGPPWSLPPYVHLELLKRPGEAPEISEDGIVRQTDRKESADALERIAHWTPKRTHTVGVVGGVVRDCVSVWRHIS